MIEENGAKERELIDKRSALARHCMKESKEWQIVDKQMGSCNEEEVREEKKIIKEVRKSLKRLKEKVGGPVIVTPVGGAQACAAPPTTVFQKDPSVVLSPGVLSYECTPAELKKCI